VVDDLRVQITAGAFEQDAADLVTGNRTDQSMY
jgi:hypothetical protein